MRSAKTIREFKSCYLRIWRRNFRENDPSGHPVFGETSNWIGVDSNFKICCKRDVITTGINFETTFKILIPFQLFGSDNLLFFGRIFKHPFTIPRCLDRFLNNRDIFEIKKSIFFIQCFDGIR